MAKNKSRGYYDPMAVVNTANLPNLIPCDRCGKKKGHHCYSKKRLGDLSTYARGHPTFDAAKQTHVNCMMCSGQGAQQLELDCIGCDRVLPHTHFNKTQRRNPDHARCEPCQAKFKDYEPGAESDDDDSDNSDCSYCSDDLGDGGSSMAGTFSSLSMNGTGNSSGGVTLNGNSTVNSNGFSNAGNSRAPSVSIRGDEVGSTATNGSTRSNWTTTATHNSNVLPPGFDASKYGTPPHLRAKTAASSIRSDAGSSGGGAWAKIRKGDAVPRPAGVPQTKETQPAPAPNVQPDDDVGVASDESDDD